LTTHVLGKVLKMFRACMPLPNNLSPYPRLRLAAGDGLVVIMVRKAGACHLAVSLTGNGRLLVRR
jgi:hypothetical protein